MSKQIVPFLHRVLVKPFPIEEIDPTIKNAKAWGFELPETMKNREQAAAIYGTVVAVGETCFLDYNGRPTMLKPDDTVIFAKYAGKEITDPESKETLVLLNDEDILGIIK